MREAYILQGPPGSGKSHWALDLIGRTQLVVRSNRDSLRESMFGDYKFDPDKEDIVTQIQYAQAREAAEVDMDFILDDTNIRPLTFNRWAIKLHILGYKVTPIRFSTPVDVCLERNKHRARPVPPHVVAKYFVDMQTYIANNRYTDCGTLS